MRESYEPYFYNRAKLLTNWTPNCLKFTYSSIRLLSQLENIMYYSLFVLRRKIKIKSLRSVIIGWVYHQKSKHRPLWDFLGKSEEIIVDCHIGEENWIRHTNWCLFFLGVKLNTSEEFFLVLSGRYDNFILLSFSQQICAKHEMCTI